MLSIILHTLFIIAIMIIAQLIHQAKIHVVIGTDHTYLNLVQTTLHLVVIDLYTTSSCCCTRVTKLILAVASRFMKHGCYRFIDCPQLAVIKWWWWWWSGCHPIELTAKTARNEVVTLLGIHVVAQWGEASMARGEPLLLTNFPSP